MLAPKIMIIRHAEKPDDNNNTNDPGNGPPYGVQADGTQDRDSLVVQGWQRAGALAALFAPSGGPFQNPELATPRFLYATGVGHHSESKRPQETITPLSAKLALPINTNFFKGDEEAMTKDALSQNGTVLICWQHEDILPTIVSFIPCNVRTPPRWPGSRFDIVLVFDLIAGSSQYNFSQVPQLLLAGDSASAIAI
jgi:hypothetical protein